MPHELGEYVYFGNRRPLYHLSIDDIGMEVGINRRLHASGVHSIGSLMENMENGVLHRRFSDCVPIIRHKLGAMGYLPYYFEHIYELPFDVLDFDTCVYDSFEQIGVWSVGDVLDVMQRFEDGLADGWRIQCSAEFFVKHVEQQLREHGYHTRGMLHQELREWFTARYPGGVDDLKRELVDQGHLPPEAL